MSSRLANEIVCSEIHNYLYNLLDIALSSRNKTKNSLLLTITKSSLKLAAVRILLGKKSVSFLGSTGQMEVELLYVPCFERSLGVSQHQEQ